MSTIKKTYFLNKAENNELSNELFINYYETLNNDEHFNKVLIKIIDEVQILEVKNGKLFKNKDDAQRGIELKEQDMLITDIFGKHRFVKFIKKLMTCNNSYELRINYEYVKHRILVFPVDIPLERMETPFITYSYAFGKEERKEDKTQALLESSQRIRDSIYGRVVDYRDYYDV